MVKKVKRFIVFILLSFLYSLLFNRPAEAASKGARVCLIPKTKTGNLKYNGVDAGVDARQVGAEMCDTEWSPY